MINQKYKVTMSLGLKLFIITIFSLTCSVIVFFVSKDLIRIPVSKVFSDVDRIQEKIVEERQSLQDFIYENNIDENSIYEIDTWIESHKYVVLYVSDPRINEIIYSNDYFPETNGIVYGANSEFFYMARESQNSLLLADGQYYYLDIFYTSRAEIETVLTYTSVFVSILTFILVFYLCMQVIKNRILKMIHEIQLIGAGTPNVYLTESGMDELGILSDEVNALVRELSSRNEEIILSEKALKDLVTNLSHDFRTPLTSLIGYITLMRYETDSIEKDKLLNRCETKAFQIKDISDELFSVFSTLSLNEQSELPTETLYIKDFCAGFSEQIIEEVRHEGFNVKLIHEEVIDDLYAQLNLYYMDRLRNNIISNILKYARKDKVVTIKTNIALQNLLIEVENDINPTNITEESSGFGLMSCRKIVEAHNGQFTVVQNHKVFKILISIPIKIL